MPIRNSKCFLLAAICLACAPVITGTPVVSDDATAPTAQIEKTGLGQWLPLSQQEDDVVTSRAAAKAERITKASGIRETIKSRRALRGPKVKVDKQRRLQYSDFNHALRPPVRHRRKMVPDYQNGPKEKRLVYRSEGPDAEAFFAAVDKKETSTNHSRRLQDEDEPEILDFSMAGEEVVEGTEEEVVKGTLTVKGRFLMTQIVDVSMALQATMQGICGCDPETDEDCVKNYARVYFAMMQDIETFGQPIIGLEIDWWILSELGGGATLCADDMAIAGFGNPEPPFDLVPEPVFRLLLTQQLRGNVITFTLDTSEWFVELGGNEAGLPECGTYEVIYPITQPPLDEEGIEKVGDRLCGIYEAGDGGAGDFLNSGGAEWETPGAMCGFAKSACGCAALGKCSWGPNTAGAYRCIDGGRNAYVSCDVCPYPYQVFCDQDPSDACRMSATPCTCASTYGACFWSASAGICLTTGANNERTPCTSCPYQWFCNLPEIDKIKPRIGKTIPKGDEYYINVTFDRMMSFQTLGSKKKLNFGAFAFSCRRPPPSLPAVFNIARHRLFWLTLGDDPNTVDWGAQEGNILHIHVNGTVNKKMADCDFIMSTKAVQDRDTRIAYCGDNGNGLDIGEYTFNMADTVGPELADFFPKNGAGNQPLDTKISFIFNEDVSIGDNPRAVLRALGGAGTTTNDSIVVESVSNAADSIIHVFDLWLEAVCEDNKLTLMMPPNVLTNDGAFSVGLAAGAVEDRYKNQFLGLKLGVFTFKSGPPTFKNVLQEPDEGIGKGIMIMVVAIVLVIWCGMLGICYLTMKVFNQKTRVTVSVKQDKFENPKKLKREPTEWDGSYHSQYKMDSPAHQDAILSNPRIEPPNFIDVSSPRTSAHRPKRQHQDLASEDDMDEPLSPKSMSSLKSKKSTKSQTSVAGSTRSIKTARSIDVGKQTSPRSPGSPNTGQSRVGGWRIQDKVNTEIGNSPPGSPGSTKRKEGNGKPWSPKSTRSQAWSGTGQSGGGESPKIEKNSPKSALKGPPQTGIALRQAAVAAAEAAGACAPSGSPLQAGLNSRSASPAARGLTG